MLFTVHHQIRDPKLWSDSTRQIMADMEQGKLPHGLKGLMYLPSTDGQHADCLWEADKLDHLRSFIDGKTGKAAKNEYYEVNAQAAVGVPSHEEALTEEGERTESAMHLAM